MSFINIETEHIGFCKDCSAPIHQEIGTGAMIKMCICGAVVSHTAGSGTTTTDNTGEPPPLPHLRPIPTEELIAVDKMVDLVNEEVDEKLEVLKLILLELRKMNGEKVDKALLKG